MRTPGDPSQPGTRQGPRPRGILPWLLAVAVFPLLSRAESPPEEPMRPDAILLMMMGVGQVVTLEVPASKLREVNVALEKTAWKAFRTEFYPTYDLYPIIRDKLANPARKGP